MTNWIDVSVTIRYGMCHWPDNPPVVLERFPDLSRGDDGERSQGRTPSGEVAQ